MTRSARILLAALFLHPSAAAAQVDSLRRFALDTLTVLRTPVVAASAPFAVTLVGGAELRRGRTGQSLDQVLLAVPGVQVDDRFNPSLGDRISIRGFGARAQFGVRGVRVLVDGIPATYPDGQSSLNHVDPGSLERVEVVRGPAAALYGNASGGVIRLESAGPPDAPFAAELRSSAGADGAWRTQGIVGGARGPAWFRADLTRLTTAGYRRHARAESWLARGGAGVQRGRGEVRLSWSWVDYDAQNPGSLSDSLVRLDRRQAFARNVAQATGEQGTQAQAGVRWRYAGPVSLELAGYATLRGIDNPIPAAIVALDRRVAGARAAVSDAYGERLRLRWTLGTEVERQDDDRQNYVNQAGARGALALDQREAVRNRAAFAQASLSLPGGAELLGALRADHYRFTAHDRLPPTATNPDDSGERRFSAWSPTAGVSVPVRGGLWLFANLATAFETPTTTELVNRPDSAGGFNPALRPQLTTSGEAGLKLDLGRVGLLEASAFRARVRDQLVPFEIASAVGRVFFRNAGLSRHQGIEIGATLAPSEAFRLRAAYSYTDARFRDYTVGATDVSGNRVPGIAPHRFSASAWLHGAAGFAGAELRAVSGTPVSDTDAAGAFRSPAYTLVDLRGGLSALRSGGVRIAPWAALTNVLDRLYNASVVVNAFGGRFYEPGPGRALYLGVDLATRGFADR